MNLSKSSYCRGIQCKKILWLEKNKPEEKQEQNNDRILEQGNDIHEVARYLFGSHINIEYTENFNNDLEDYKNKKSDSLMMASVLSELYGKENDEKYKQLLKVYETTLEKQRLLPLNNTLKK